MSTSAFQIEGGLTADGRQPSIWDDVARGNGPGALDPGIGHYARWREDLALLQELGVNAYRFSVAWPRVIPTGAGPINPIGLDFYDRLVDALLAAGITPFVCLYHWDLPAALQRNGGWIERATVDAFERYARVVGGRLGDRVRHWIPINEALSVAYGGYAIGYYPPFVANFAAYLRAAHHLNLAQGVAMQALAGTGRRLGTAMCLYPVRPAVATPSGLKAAARRAASTTKLFLDPLLHGRYPPSLEENMAPNIKGGDMALVGHAVDFLGVNYYGPEYCGPEKSPFADRVVPDDLPTTEAGIVIDPHGLYEQLGELRDAYGNRPIYITENGAAFADKNERAGQVYDLDRIAYLYAHLVEVRRSMRDGVDVRGYFAWSIFDNWEWLVGFENRYGLVYVEKSDAPRLPKASYDWFRRTIASRTALPPSSL